MTVGLGERTDNINRRRFNFLSTCSEEYNANVNVGAWDLIITIKNREIILKLLKDICLHFCSAIDVKSFSS